RNAADVGEGALMRADPVRQRLRPSRFGERVARGAEHGDEDFRFLDLAGAPIDDRRRVTVNSGVQVSSQAAFLLTSLSSTPSMNFTPAMTSASCWKPRSRRHRFCALIAS